MTLFSAPDDPWSHRTRIVIAEKAIEIEIVDVAPGKYPEDLLDLNPYHTTPTLMPPLRERRSDIPALVTAFLARHAPAAQRRVAPEYLDALMGAQLTGNVRQLENLVRRSLAVADHDRPLGLADLPPELWQELAQEPVAGPAPVAAAHPSIPVELNLARALEACERDTVEQALVEAGGSQSRAADLLGITGRSVYNKNRKHRLRT
jgi:DNA-binding NtrC family response regulator